MIKPHTTCILLNTLEYQYTNINKEVFFHRHERLDVVKYQAQLWQKLEVLGLYLIKFCNDDFMEEKLDSVVNGPHKRPVILITYDKSTLLANDSQHQV